MRVVRDAWRQQDLPRGCVATIGNYDGIHLGQQEVLRKTVARAGELNLLAAAITFDPHPLSVLPSRRPPKRLTTEAQKTRLLEALGLDAVLSIHFNSEFSQLPARRFVHEFLVQALDTKEVYIGAGFTFGRDREGDLGLLRSAGSDSGLQAFAVAEVSHDGRRISSSRIRLALEEGAVEEAEAMLGRPYDLEGVVIKGDGRGRKLGWPTINLQTANELLPGDGVYAGEVSFVGGEEKLQAVTNVGTRPTVYAQTRRLMESYILDFDRSVYGERVKLTFRHRLRDEIAFPTLEALAEKIGKDVAATREYFAARDC